MCLKGEGMFRQPERLVCAGGAIAMLVAVPLPSWWAYERSALWVLIGILWPMVMSMATALATSMRLGNTEFGVIAALLHIPVSVATFWPGVFLLGPGFAAAINVAVTGFVLWKRPSSAQRLLICSGVTLCALSVAFTSGLLYNVIDGPATPLVGSLLHISLVVVLGVLAARRRPDDRLNRPRS